MCVRGGVRQAPQKGFYIGRPHPPFTEVGVVRSLDRTKPGYMKPCDESEPGLIVVKGVRILGLGLILEFILFSQTVLDPPLGSSQTRFVSVRPLHFIPL